MAEVQPPGFLNGPPVSTDAAVYREQTKALAGGLQGVCALGDFAVSQSGTPGMSVDVAAGRAIVNATTVNGAFTVRNDAAIVNLPIAAADPSNPRIDRVIIEVRPGSPDDDWQVRVVTGTPASSPSAPATPDNSLSLATVAVAAGADSILIGNITSTRTFAGLYAAESGRLWPATPFTPTWSGVTLGTGASNTGRAARVGPLVVASVSLTLGSGGSVTGAPSVSNLPYAAMTGVPPAVGQAVYTDSAVRSYPGSVAVAAGGTTIDAFVHAESGNAGSVNSSNPFAFGQNDRIQATVTYLAA